MEVCTICGKETGLFRDGEEVTIRVLVYDDGVERVCTDCADGFTLDRTGMVVPLNKLKKEN